jgi:hypothetical protein
MIQGGVAGHDRLGSYYQSQQFGQLRDINPILLASSLVSSFAADPRNRAAATASSFGVAANVKLVLARRVQRALVRHIEARLEFDDRMVMPL